MEDEPMEACYVTAHITAFPGKGEALRDVMRANIPLAGGGYWGYKRWFGQKTDACAMICCAPRMIPTF